VGTNLVKRFIIAIILLAIVVGGVVGFNMFRDQAIQQFFSTMKPAPVTVSTITIQPTTWTPGIEAIGTVGAASGVDLTVETTGVVKDINFSANQRVEAGRVLVQLDDAVQRADLEAANTRLALNQRALERAEQLLRSGAGTQSALDSARAAAETSQADFKKLQAVLNQKQLIAPFSGMMGIPRVDLGQFVQPGSVIASLQNLDTMRADFSVPEQQLGNLSIGQQVTLGLDGDAEGFSGKIAGIEPKVEPACLGARRHFQPQRQAFAGPVCSGAC
jgi:membrane fusion protein (multidrug efflux system)